MTIDKLKLQKLLWSEVASWKADCREWKQNAEALGEFLGEKTLEEVALEVLAENEDLKTICAAFDRVNAKLKAENEALNTAIEDLDKARVAGFEEYDFTRLKDRHGDKKVFEITIETECGCDIEEGEYTVRITHLLGNWLGSDDFGLIGDAVAEVVADLGLPEEGHTTFIAYESGERQDVFWTKWFEIATVASVLVEPGAAMGKGEQS
jgi:hypothetical protein